MASSYKDLIQQGKSKRNALDSFMGFFGQGVDNENYTPGVDADGNVKALTLGERLSGISMAEKEAANARVQLRDAKRDENFQYLEAEGQMTEGDLGRDISRADLAKKTRDFSEVKTAETAARVEGVDAQAIAELKNSGLGATAISSGLYDLTRKQKEFNANETLRNSPGYQDRIEQRDYQRNRNRIADERLAFDREQAAQLRRDQLIENKEARIGQQEMQLLQLNRDERIHNANLEYKREQDAASRRENIAAALSSLAMSFFA